MPSVRGGEKGEMEMVMSSGSVLFRTPVLLLESPAFAWLCHMERFCCLSGHGWWPGLAGSATGLPRVVVGGEAASHRVEAALEAYALQPGADWHFDPEIDTGGNG